MFVEPPLPNARNLAGSWIGLRLTDGSRLEGQLISAGTNGVQSLWLLVGDGDEFVPLCQVRTICAYRPWHDEGKRNGLPYFTATASTQTSSSGLDGATSDSARSHSSAGDRT